LDGQSVLWLITVITKILTTLAQDVFCTAKFPRQCSDHVAAGDHCQRQEQNAGYASKLQESEIKDLAAYDQELGNK
jgi:hypothetical protein